MVQLQLLYRSQQAAMQAFMSKYTSRGSLKSKNSLDLRTRTDFVCEPYLYVRARTLWCPRTNPSRGPAVGSDDLAINPPPLLSDQESDHARDVVRLPDSSQRRGLGVEVDRLGRLRAQHSGKLGGNSGGTSPAR